MYSLLIRGYASLAVASVRSSPLIVQQLQQKRWVVVGFPTLQLHCSLSNELPLSSIQLRERLQRQLRDGAPRMQTIDTEGRLVLTLARSPHVDDRVEALERAEVLWNELQDPASPLPMTSRTGLRMSLCTGMRRCALVSRKHALAETWTERFAQRKNIRPEDFTTGPSHTPGEVLGWRQVRERARPGTGIDDEDILEDAEEDEAEMKRAGSSKKQSGSNNERTPIQQYRHDVFLDHPMMQRAFKGNVHSPGPRYTGD